MGKSIYITEAQLEKFKKRENFQKISPLLRNMVDDDNSPIKIFSSPVRKGIIGFLTNGFNNAIDEFKDDITQYTEDEVSSKLSKLIAVVKKKEEPIRVQLEGLCEEVVSKFVNDSIDIECKIVTTIPDTHCFHITPNRTTDEFESLDEYNEVDGLISKRKVMNTLTMGCAMHLYDIYFDKIIGQLFKFDEDLPHLYSKILKINNYLIYISNNEITDNENFQTGYVHVTPNISVRGYGIIFPFLLIETFRGVIENISSKYFMEMCDNPQEIFEKSDLLKYEPYYMTVGRELWNKIYKTDDKKNIIPFINELLTTNNHKFISLFNEISANTSLGRQEIRDLLSKVRHKTEYSDFERELKKRNDKVKLLLASEMSEEELNEDSIDEATYPENFNMNVFKSLSSYSKRVAYCNEHLIKIGAGSSRIVYKIDDDTVLKLAKNKKGLAQNEYETELGQQSWLDLFGKVYESDDNYLWIEMQYARPAKKSDFKRICGYGFDVIQNYVQYYSNFYRRRTQYDYVYAVSQEYKDLFDSDKFSEELENTDSIFYSLTEYLGNYQLESIGDLQRITSWGVIKDGSDEKLVVIDGGLSDDVFKQFYGGHH